MKVETEGQQAVITLEDPHAQNVFLRGRENMQMWNAHPETYELNQFLQTNREYSQIFVKCYDSHVRIK